MANKTTNYGLIKPLGTESYDINVQNNNMDIIDAELKKRVELEDGKIPSNVLPIVDSKRTVRFTVASSVNGWGEADCDYLCDGTNDHSKINEAIAALPSTGGEIVLLDGVYTIKSSIKIDKSNVTLSGNGTATKLVRGFSGSSVNPADICVTGTNCMVRDISMDGVKETYTTRSYGNGIKSTGENNTIMNCYIFNHIGHGIHIVANHNSVVHNTLTSNYTGIAIEGNDNIIKGNINTNGEKHGISLTNANCNTIIGNVCRLNGDQNIYFDASSYNIVNENNCAILSGDAISPTICIFISTDDCVGNIVIDNLLGTGSVTDWGANNNGGMSTPTTRKINNKTLSSDITLSASDVGAAPSGYGLGSALPAKTIANCDDAIQTGWYKVSAGATNSPVTNEFLMRVEMSNVLNGMQTAIIGNGDVIKVRSRNSAVWSEWKNVNSKLTINGVTYDGAEATDMTDAVKSLIETELGVIENGTY